MKATDAAARHLRDLRERFGSLYLAAAAYNAGAGKVSRSLGKLEWDTPVTPPAEAADSALADSAGPDLAVADATLAERWRRRRATRRPIPSTTPAPRRSPKRKTPTDEVDARQTPEARRRAAFFRLASNDLLAAETRSYVPKLIAAALIAKAPGHYGFAVPEPAPSPTTRWWWTTPPASTWWPVWPGRAWPTCRELDPQYLRLVTPPRSTMVIRLPAGSGAAVAEGYAKLSPKSRVHYMTHVVGRREKLSAESPPATTSRCGDPRLPTRNSRDAAGQGHAPRRPAVESSLPRSRCGRPGPSAADAPSAVRRPAPRAVVWRR